MAAEKKTTIKKPKKIVKAEEKSQYWEAIGRRKTSSARVRIWSKGTGFIVNNQQLKDYLRISALIQEATSPFEKAKLLSKSKVTVQVRGGGPHSQAQAIRHGLARVLVKRNPDLHKTMRDAGFLTRDPRMKERKKPGKKRARKSPQWSKR